MSSLLQAILPTCNALSIPVWIPISISFVVWMSVLAMRFLSGSALSTRRHQMIMTRWINQLLKILSALSSCHDSIRFQSRHFCEYVHIIFDAVCYNFSRIPTISRVFSWRRPLAIRWLIIAVSIDSIKLKTGRTLSHIFQKCSETIDPPFTNGNSSASIKMKALIIGIRAALFHLNPSCIERMSFCSRAKSMFFHEFTMPVSWRHCNEF